MRLATERVALSSIKNRICAEHLTSPLNIPPFDNAAMDGFAVRSGDPQTLTVTAQIIAGDTINKVKIASGECCAIMTGAPIPKGVDSIVPIEQTSREGDTISFTTPASFGDHIRKAGSDVIAGASILTPGVVLGTQHVLPLSAIGIGMVEVYSKPKIAFISTGREVVDHLNQPLMEGQIYNSNLPYACAVLAEAGAEISPQPTIPDTPAQFQDTILRLMQEDFCCIVSSGAVSAGSHDFIRSSLEDMGASILFHKVAIKPGKPILFAKLPNGMLYFGLPGNPVSTAVGLRFFVQPFLSALLRQSIPDSIFARAKTALSSKNKLRLFLKAKITVTSDGILEVEFLDGQESYKTTPFLSMNGWAVIPEERVSIDLHDKIEVFPLTFFS